MTGDTILGLKSYLGESGLADGGDNIFGETIDLYLEPYPAGQDLIMEYFGIPSGETCRRILERFGEVTEVSATQFKIEPGKTISGYVGGEFDSTGCEISTKTVTLYLTID